MSLIHGRSREEKGYDPLTSAPFSEEVSLVRLTAQGPRPAGPHSSTILQGCYSPATKLDSWLWKFNVRQLHAASGVQHFKKVN